MEESGEDRAAEKDKRFQPIGMSLDGEGGETAVEAASEVGPQAAAAAANASADAAAGKPSSAAAAGEPAASAVAAQAKKETPPGVEGQRDSAPQKTCKLA